MRTIGDAEKAEVSALFTGLWNFLKKNYHPETDADWTAMMEAARCIPIGEEDAPLHKLGVSMTTAVLNYIEANNK